MTTKKFLIMCCIAIFFPLVTYAISLDELQSNPERYKKMDENLSNATFIDTYTIKSTSYAPPHYTLQVKAYYVYYHNRYEDKEITGILERLETYHYDYDKSPAKIYNDQINAYYVNKYKKSKVPQSIMNEFIDAALSKARKDSGISYSAAALKTYDLDGKLLASNPEPKDSPLKPVKLGTFDYFVADFIFATFYNIPFCLGTNY